MDFLMNNIDSKSHIWFYFYLHQGKRLFLNGQVRNTSDLWLHLFYINHWKPILSERIIVNLKTFKEYIREGEFIFGLYLTLSNILLQ